MNITFTPHALFEMNRRDLTEEIVRDVIDLPDQSWEIRNGRFLYQKSVKMGKTEKQYLVRVVADTDRDQIEGVTAYRTSKIEKYWREK
ncbi:MAG: DUF4258 domain-containing protein [Deltaproteobacteria bacterium]|nr:DUF4258 domain-containing protein [Deltaproteobacteria bacterium]